MNPKFTIGIPTYNRATLLPVAISAALNQSYDNLEVIVCDNASTDDTPAVVRRFGDCVRYVRNPENIGPAANFCRLVELASGEYFSWLQDDDCIFQNFAARAAECLGRYSRATAYGAYSAVASNLSYLSQSWLYGPPLELDWAALAPRVVSADLIAPLSLCVTVAMPPVVAFRTAALQQCTARCDLSIPLLMERTILADVAVLGEAVFDPCVAGVFRTHAKQGFRVMQAENPDAMRQQWLKMAVQLDAIPFPRDEAWRGRLREAIDQLNVEIRERWEIESRSWPLDIGLCRETRAALLGQPSPSPSPSPSPAPIAPYGLAKTVARAARSLFSRSS